MRDLLTGPLGLLVALAAWFLVQAVILPKLGVGT